jgi:predicted ferric reductase
LTIFSHSKIRAIWYELWLNVHWICAIGFYISLFYHAYGELNANKYMIATIVFWGTQLCWRAINKSFLRPNSGFLRSNNCKMRIFASNSDKDHYFEIIIQNSNEFSWVSGQHLFVRIPGLRFLENHPFSIVSSYEKCSDSNIKLIIKACNWGGMTNYIYSKLPDNGHTDFNVFIDGPYGGCERQICAFDSIYLLASGTGISAILPFLMDSCKNIHSGSGNLKKARLDWIIQNSQNIEWIFEELQTIINKYNYLILQKNIEINIHVKEDMSDSNYDSLQFLNPICENPINIVNQKPTIRAIIEKHKDTLERRNIYIVSGSDSMKVEASNVLADLQLQVLESGNIEEIYLHTESFGW